MIPVEVFVGSLATIVTLVSGGYGGLFLYIRSQSTAIATLNADALKNAEERIGSAERDRDYFRDLLFDTLRIAETSTGNTRKAIERSGGYGRN